MKTVYRSLEAFLEFNRKDHHKIDRVEVKKRGEVLARFSSDDETTSIEEVVEYVRSKAREDEDDLGVVLEVEAAGWVQRYSHI